MEKNIEVELKFQILDEDEMEEFARSLNFINEKRVIDTYLDTEEGNLYKRGIFIRIRNGNQIDFKFNLDALKNKNEINRHEHCDELSFPLPLPQNSVAPINKICEILGLKGIIEPNIEELKTKNNLIDSVIIDKIRKDYTDKKFNYSLDKVDKLGKFIEIEFMASKDDDIEKVKDEMRDKLKNLKLKLITAGYTEVYWHKFNFNLYLQGRYLFEEDYAKYRPADKK